MSLVRKVAKDVGVPEWWAESIAIEYTDCREYAVDGKICKFNFEKVKSSLFC